MQAPEHLGAGPDHWDAVHEARAPEQLTWFQPTPQMSLELIQRSGIGPARRIVDVGGGSSRLCDELLKAGYRDVTSVDISSAALSYVAARTPDTDDCLTLVEADVGEFRSDRPFDLWHDRAVFHFLIEQEARERYVDSLLTNLNDRGFLVIATFGLQGPEKCSGLPVQRYSPDSLRAAFGTSFEPVEFAEEVHSTPSGGTQPFIYGLFSHGKGNE